MKCKNCGHDKRDHTVNEKNQFLRGKYKGEYNGENERYEPFACVFVGCSCKGFK